MTKVKICGLTTMRDIEIINELKPDYAGFIFCPSKRRLTVYEAQKLCSNLKSGIKKVGVFVNEDRSVLEETVDACGLDIVQLHGDERPEDCRFPGCEVWKAFRIKGEEDLALMGGYSAVRFLLDAYTEGAYGGSGRTFNWDILKRFGRRGEIVLAGGLNLENVETAITAVSPYAVDVSSGVETDGHKDFDKVKDFIEKARRQNV